MKHLPLCPTLWGCPSLWCCVSGSWAAAGRGSLGWAACRHDAARQAWAGVGRQWALSAATVPHEGAPLAPAPPARVGSPLRLAGREQLPFAAQPQAHLLPSHPLSVQPTLHLLGGIFPLWLHWPYVPCASGFSHSSLRRDAHLGWGPAGERGLFPGPLPRGWRVQGVHSQRLLIHLETPMF